jgi:hypothetical protein
MEKSSVNLKRTKNLSPTKLQVCAGKKLAINSVLDLLEKKKKKSLQD